MSLSLLCDASRNSFINLCDIPECSQQQAGLSLGLSWFGFCAGLDPSIFLVPRRGDTMQSGQDYIPDPNYVPPPKVLCGCAAAVRACACQLAH